MSRLHLGDRGEKQAKHLLDTFALTRDFRVAVVTSPDVRALDELRRRLALVADAVYHWPPDDELFRRLDEIDTAQAKNVYWIQGMDEDTWREPLQRLNFAREKLRHDHPGLWVYAGPPDLGRWMARNATDTLSVASTEISLDRRPAFLPDEPLRPLRWIHLSDLHFEGDQKWERRTSMKALIRHAVEEKEAGCPPDFLFCTGDVASQGKPAEFVQAKHFFNELTSALELDPAEQLFVVPGNHDVDRSAIGPGAILADHLKSTEQVDDVLRHAPSMDLLGERLQAFYSFTAEIQGRARGLRKARPWRVDHREVAGVSVAIAQLNSAWVSGWDDEEKKLLVGQEQLRDALDAMEGAALRIALIHHPLGDLRDFDHAAAETVLGSPGGVHFLLYGHRHRTRSYGVHCPDGLLMRLAAPAGHSSVQWPRGYLSAELDLEAGKGLIRFFRYSTEGRGFWTPDTGAYEGARDGVWRFDLPPGLTFGGEAADDAEADLADLSESRRSSLAARFRSAAAAVHGSVRFLGFGSERTPGRRRQVDVPELYVPLRVGRRGADEVTVSTAELLETLTPGENEAARIALLGGPGSGKTTLLRFLTVGLAGETELPVEGEPLPLFLPFRELVRGHAGPRDWPSFEEYLRDEAKRRLQVPLPEQFFAEALEEGRAVLLLDGLDEVGSEAHRLDACDRVKAFCRSYPRVPVLVTSRIAGYERSALSEDGRMAFEHFEVLPFDDGELGEFIERWYAIQEPTDSDARESGAARLNAALAARPRVLELARNPMLATLIAMVHRFEARLPGERAELYRLCIKTLLETWPEERRRPFREIDPGRQRAYLERFAWRLQSAREDHARDVTFERDSMLPLLLDIVADRDGEAEGDEAAARKALLQRWLVFLEEGSGLLVEQQPGLVGFFHLSLMEYLAAQELLRSEHPAKNLAKRAQEPAWREVCLLAIGSQATEKAFLDRVVQAIEATNWAGRFHFLLQAMREEADLDDGQRDRIGRGFLRWFAEKWSRFGFANANDFEQLAALSVRHAEWAKSWFDERIREARGDELRGLVLLRGDRWDELRPRLERRPDVAMVASDLVALWRFEEIWPWAVEQADPSALLVWGLEEAPFDLALIYGIDYLRSRLQSRAVQNSLLIAQLKASSAFSQLHATGARSVSSLERPGGRGLPTSVVVQPGQQVLPTDWRPFPLPTSSVEISGGRAFSRNLTRDLSRAFSSAFSSSFSRAFSSAFSRDFTRAFSGGFSHAFSSGFSRAFSSDFSYGLSRDFSRAFSHGVSPAFAIAPSTQTFHAPSPGAARPPTFLDRTDFAARNGKNEEAVAELTQGVALQLAEFWIALVTLSKNEVWQAAAYAERRSQHRWLLEVWRVVDEFLGESPPGDDALALYFGLGWTQACTTWTFPGTPRWVELIESGPAKHWLPRSQWHACFLVEDAESEEHWQGLRAAIEEGLVDEERPGVAKALSEMLLPIQSE